MKRLFFILLAFIFFSSASAHMCHDPFRPRERLLLVPEDDLIRIEKSGEFRIYVENTFRSALREVKLCVQSPAFDIEVEPAVIARLIPGERSFFLLRLQLRAGFAPGDYPLLIGVEAASAEVKPSIEAMDVLVEEAPAAPEGEEISPQIKPQLRPEETVAPRVEEAGRVVVRVERFVLAQRYYLYLIPIGLIIGWLIWRKFRPG